MMTKNNKIIIGVVVVLIIAVGLFFMMQKNKQAVEYGDNTNNTDTTTEPTESAQDITTGATGASAVSISYANALIQYKDRRIQLDKGCQANPNIVTYKDNTGIMIDNRSAVARTVKVGTTFTIKPWGFKIVVLPDTYLTAKTLLVDCDQYQNIATVLVQE